MVHELSRIRCFPVLMCVCVYQEIVTSKSKVALESGSCMGDRFS